jgi:membrane protein required for colicin V production
VILDLACLGALALAAIAGAWSGALRQLATLSAAGLALLGARALAGQAAEVAARFVPRFVAAPLGAAAAFVALFLALAFVLALVARAARAVGAMPAGPDRALGALLGGAKAALVLWVLVSALVAWGRPLPIGSLRLQAEQSGFAAFAREHNALGALRGRGADGERAAERR